MQAYIFPPAALPTLQTLGDIGLILYMFSLGARLDTYRFTDAELHGALRQLLGDRALRDRLATGAAQIQARQGLRRAADLIEGAADTR